MHILFMCVLYYIVLKLLFYIYIILYCRILCYIILHYILLCYIILCYIILCYIILYDFIWYEIKFNYFILYIYIILYIIHNIHSIHIIIKFAATSLPFTQVTQRSTSKPSTSWKFCPTSGALGSATAAGIWSSWGNDMEKNWNTMENLEKYRYDVIWNYDDIWSYLYFSDIHGVSETFFRKIQIWYPGTL